MSGSTIGGAVGAVVGFYFGGPQGAQWGWMIGSAVGGYVDPTQIEGPRLQDARTQTSRDGVAIPFGWGTFPLAGNVIAQGPVVEHKKKERQGKGGPEVTTYSYTRTYAIGLCEGPITGLLQIKRNGKVVYDARTDAEIEEELTRGGYTGLVANLIAKARASNSAFMNKATIYLGDETQMPDPALEAIFGAGNVPAHRGLAYFVVEDDDVTDLAGAIPQYEVVVVAAGVVSASAGKYVPATYPSFINAGYPLVDSADLYLAEGFNNASPVQSIAGNRISEILAAVPEKQVFIGWRSRSTTSWPLSLDGEQDDPSDNYFVSLYYSAVEPDEDTPSWPPPGGAVNGRYYRDIGEATSARVIVRLPGGVAPDGFVLLSGDDFVCNPTLIYAKRVEIQPTSGGVAVPDAPGFYIDPFGDVVDYTNLAAVTSGTFKGLLHSEFSTPQPNRIVYSQYLCGPILRSDHPDYDSQGFWEGSYSVAVASGLAPSGLTYGVDYPNLLHSISTTHHAISAPEIYESGGGQAIETDSVSLSTIVANVCEQRGIVADEREVSQLTDLVTGFVVGRETDAASIIQSLAPAYFFDPGEWDGKLRFIKRGGTAVGSINGDDLVERDGDAFERERVQEAELLRRVTVGYNDPQAAYSLTTQKWERRAGTVQALGEASVELPLTLDADDAATIAKRRGLTAWGEPEKQKFSLPYRLSKYTPTDVLNFTDDDGQVYPIRLMDLQDDSGIRYVEASANSAEAYGATATGVVPRPPSITEPSLRGPTKLAVMDLPLWRSSDTDTLGLYVAARGYLGGWQGAQVDVSTDTGVSYSEAAQITLPATIGVTTTALAAWVSSEYPSVQTVTVTLPDAPESVSYEALLRYNNRAAIQLDDGRWEILQYQTVVANGNDSYTLSGLVRGRYATTPGAAAAEATFVLLDAAVQFVPVERHLLGQTFKVRATTYGTSSDAAVASDFAFTAGASQTEWPVHGVTATRDVSDNVTVSWIGRARLGTETAPYHSNNFAGYRVSWDDGTTVATADTTGTTYTITAAADPIDVTVTPLNSITGAGPASEVITV